MFSVWVRKGQARLVMAGKEGESVYQLDTGEFGGAGSGTVW